MKTLNLTNATKRYNDLMESLGYEHNTIGTELSENTENWNLRDMVAECDYTLSTFYEEGHANNEGRYIEHYKATADDLMNGRINYIMRKNVEQEEMHKAWLSYTRRLRNFIKAYEPFIEDMVCAEGHCSDYD